MLPIHKDFQEATQKNTKESHVYSTITPTQGTVLKQKGVICVRLFCLTAMVGKHRQRVWDLAPFLQCSSQRLCAYPDNPDPFLHGYSSSITVFFSFLLRPFSVLWGPRTEQVALSLPTSNTLLASYKLSLRGTFLLHSTWPFPGPPRLDYVLCKAESLPWPWRPLFVLQSHLGSPHTPPFREVNQAFPSYGACTGCSFYGKVPRSQPSISALANIDTSFRQNHT